MEFPTKDGNGKNLLPFDAYLHEVDKEPSIVDKEPSIVDETTLPKIDLVQAIIEGERTAPRGFFSNR